VVRAILSLIGFAVMYVAIAASKIIPVGAPHSPAAHAAQNRIAFWAVAVVAGFNILQIVVKTYADKRKPKPRSFASR
jgi:hypothetical protein